MPPLNYLVTGAARGIGRGLTRSLLKSGHRVFLLDSNEPELQNTLSLASSWASSEGAFRGKVVDLGDRSAIKIAVGDVSDFFGGRLDVLVNNAIAVPHIWRDGKSMDEGDEDDIMAQWDEKIAVGLSAPFLLSRLLVPLLKAVGDDSDGQAKKVAGCIINISSTRASQAEDNHESYSTVKAGILGLTQSLAVSLGHKYNIRVNAISPGWIHVGNENKEADERGLQWEDDLTKPDHQWHPSGRVGKVDDIVKAVTFLAESGFVTGENIVIDGGVTRKMVYPEE